MAFWLIPAAPFDQSFGELIAALANEYEAPVFEPHITLHVGVKTSGDDIAALLRRVAAMIEPIALIAGDTGHSDALFKTLFVEFEDSRLHTLHDRLRHGLTQLSAKFSNYTLAPHMSLLYKNLTPTVRGILARRYAFRGQRIVFDQIAAVRPAAGSSDWADIGSWDSSLRQIL